MQLLPKDQELGWTPYAWLIYLLLFVASPFLQPSTWVDYAVVAVGLVIFLPLYFYGHWARGRRLLAVIAAIVALAVLLTPGNFGAAAFFIYGAAFLGQLPPPSRAVRYLFLIVMIVVAETLIFDLDPRSWVPAVVFSILIGGVNIHFGEVSRTNQRLKLAQREVEQLATVAERERIARDLHDLLGHTLSVITLKSELAAKLVGSDTARAEREMREVESISREALAEVRQAVQGYRTLGLPTELTNAKMALGAAGVELTVEGTPFDLPATHEGVLALALREAVTNVVRHARAGRCTVRLRQAGGEFQLEVQDDGRGGRIEEGSGLAGLRERIVGLGGSLEVDGTAGMRLLVSLPLTEDALARIEEKAGRAGGASP